jgi:hypothetical protein
MNSIGEHMADQFIKIEQDLNLQFDSMLCSLYSGIFGGTSTAIWLQKKYNRNINVAVSRRSYIQQTIHPKLSQSIHFTSCLIVDDFLQSLHNDRDVLFICLTFRVISTPQEVQFISISILLYFIIPAGFCSLFGDQQSIILSRDNIDLDIHT